MVLSENHGNQKKIYINLSIGFDPGSEKNSAWNVQESYMYVVDKQPNQ